jgi:hypothetical protein
VTVHGQPSAVLPSPDDLAMLDETIAVLGDQDLMMRLAAAEADLAAGRVESPRGSPGVIALAPDLSVNDQHDELQIVASAR